MITSYLYLLTFTHRECSVSGHVFINILIYIRFQSSSPYNKYNVKSKKYETLSKELEATCSEPSSDYVPPTDKYITFSEALKAVQSRQQQQGTVTMSKINTGYTFQRFKI